LTEAETNPESEADHLARIEAETEAAAQAENDRMLLQMSPYLMMGGCLGFAVLSPLLTIWLGSLPFSQTAQRFTAWLWVEIPVVVYAAIVFRRARLKLPDGRVYTGWRVRAGAALAVLASLAFFWVRMWPWG